MSTSLYSKGGVPRFVPSEVFKNGQSATFGVNRTGLTITTDTVMTLANTGIELLSTSSGAGFDPATGIFTLPDHDRFWVRLFFVGTNAISAITEVAACQMKYFYSIAGDTFRDADFAVGVVNVDFLNPVDVKVSGEYASNAGGAVVASGGCIYYGSKLNPSRLAIRLHFTVGDGTSATAVTAISGWIQVDWE